MTHKFFCINCGNEGMTFYRKYSREKFHRKKLYCLNCCCEVNHIECRNEDEVNEFKERFKNGEFKQEGVTSVRRFQKKMSRRRGRV